MMTSTDSIRRFLLAGEAIFTLVSVKTGVRRTYQVRAASEGAWFVGLLSGPDNTSDYAYLGMLYQDPDRLRFRWTAKSKAAPTSASFLGFSWLITMVNQAPELNASAEFHHAGTCGRCGRLLTDPESIEAGLGPVCREKTA